MSTWTCRVGGPGVRVLARPKVAVCALFVLAGCVDATGRNTAGEGGRAVPIARQVSLAEGAVVVVPPSGYCIDASSISNRPSGGFALIASCESLTGRVSTLSVEPAVITVTVSSAREGREQPQAELLSNALPQGVAVREMNGDGLTIVQAEADNSALPGARGDRKHWRGAMVINDRLVGLALYGAPGSLVSGPEGERLLVALAEDIRETSPFLERAAQQATSPDPAATVRQSPDAPNAAPRQPLRSVFSRLFP